MVNQSPRPIHNVNIRVILPSLREYNRRRRTVPNLDLPEYNKRQWKEAVTPLNDMVRFYWGNLEGGLPETVVA